MKMRILTALALSVLLAAPLAGAGWLDELKEIFEEEELSEDKIIDGLKEALRIGAEEAVEITGKKNGFWKNKTIRIPVPERLEKVEKTLRKIGLDDQVDDFHKSMNRAAEAAAPHAKKLFIGAVKDMTFRDARKILKGEKNAATDYLEQKTRDRLFELFRPTVEKKLDEVGSTRALDKIIGRYNDLPLVKPTSFDLNEYVTDKTLDGLFKMVAREEERIRENPKARITELLKEVFGD